MNKTYKSAVDWWMIPILALGMVVPVGITLWAAVSGASDDLWAGLLSVGLVGAVYRGLVFPLYYTLTDDHLLVCFGMVKQRILYTEIAGAHFSNSLLSSPALSMRRLQINRRTGFSVLISPVDRGAFLDALAERVPGARREGPQLLVE
jgi:hypothetical protein